MGYVQAVGSEGYQRFEFQGEPVAKVDGVFPFDLREVEIEVVHQFLDDVAAQHVVSVEFDATHRRRVRRRAWRNDPCRCTRSRPGPVAR